MSKQNPRKAMAALLPPGGADIRPMTLGMYAALERIGSPLVTGVPAKDTLELIPSLYLLTHDPREVFRGNILEAAMAWADSVPAGVIASIRESAERQMSALYDVVPESDEKKKGHEPGDGWIASMLDWAARAYGWGWSELMWEVPASALALLRRQECRGRDGRWRIYPLSEIERVDDGEQEAEG